MFSVRAQTAATLANAGIQVIPDRRTSIIYIQCHGLGTGDLSCYGQTNFQTPNLDKLAAEGVRFTDFRPGWNQFCHGPGRVALREKKPAVKTAIRRPHVCKAAGYHTCLVGEWGLGGKPRQRGFEEFAGFLNEKEGRNYYADTLYHFAPHESHQYWSNTIADFDGPEGNL